VQRKGYILIVETDDLIRELLERWLGEAGYTVRTSAPPAAETAGAPSLIIVNIPSPRGAGSLIRSLQTTYAAPILAVSARFRRGLGGSTDAARQLGTTRVLPKPFTRAELLAAVRDSIKD
jgi:DNA-binding response OmpR family regulator